MRAILLLITLTICIGAAAQSSTIQYNDTVAYCDITVSEFGQLAQALGDDALLIDSLVVNGPVDYRDFTIMRNASINGRLEVINLESAQLKDNEVPDSAFCYPRQFKHIPHPTDVVSIRRIMLPNETRHIGKCAFMYAGNIESFTFPAELRTIDKKAFFHTDLREAILPDSCKLIGDSIFGTNALMDYCYLPDGISVLPNGTFSECRLRNSLHFPASLDSIGHLAFSCCFCLPEIELPAGLKYIGRYAFRQCIYLNRAKLPNTLTTIETCAFYGCYKLEEVELPDQLKSLGNHAFSNCNLKEISIPDSCLSLGYNLFDHNPLIHATLPEDITTIPEGIFSGCYYLSDVNIPARVDSIKRLAFSGCAFTEIHLPEGLIYIGEAAFSGCEHVEKLFCKAAMPPECILHPNSYYLKHPFDGVPADIPVYVPVGSAELYRNASGWDHFSCFIETDEFPSTGTVTVTADPVPDSDAPLHDILGRRISAPRPGHIYIRDGRKILFDGR